MGNQCTNACTSGDAPKRHLKRKSAGSKVPHSAELKHTIDFGVPNLYRDSAESVTGTEEEKKMMSERLGSEFITSSGEASISCSSSVCLPSHNGTQSGEELENGGALHDAHIEWNYGGDEVFVVCYHKRNRKKKAKLE